MLSCLISFLVAVLVAVIVLWALEVGAGALGVTLPANVLMLVRVIVALILLMMALECLIGRGGFQWRIG